MKPAVAFGTRGLLARRPSVMRQLRRAWTEVLEEPSEVDVKIPLLIAFLAFAVACQSIPTRDALPGERVPPPTPVERKPFPIPDRALREEIEASITLDMMIEGNGRVSDVRVLQSEPPGILDRNAIRAARAWNYEAPVVDGVRVRVRSEPVTVYFFLNRCPDPAADSGDFIKICARAMP